MIKLDIEDDYQMSTMIGKMKIFKNIAHENSNIVLLGIHDIHTIHRWM